MGEGLYSIYDRVAEEYSMPIACKNDGTAFRMFRNQMEKVPGYVEEEYWLMKVGEWDKSKGKVTEIRKPIRIERAVLDE
jgi:hypothetical protein